MTNGTGTTFILHPTGRNSLTLATHTAKPTGNYIITLDVGSVELNLDQRLQFIYEQVHARRAPETFVPLRFTVVIKATTAAARQQAYNALDQAARAGGKLQYKPENASRDTYYDYAPSAPPRLLDDRRNRWDAAPTSDGHHTAYVDVELQTRPLATSDPETPVTITSLGGTLDNWTTNALTVDGDEILGSVPALVRLLITPASGQALGRVLLFTRSAADGTLADLITLYEAEDAAAIYPSVAWTEIADAARGGGAYLRCLPPIDANGFAQGLRFTLLNPQDCKGRFAVFGVGYDDASTTGVWTHQVKLRSGNLSQEGASDYYADSTQSWQLLFAGEFELPLTDVADVTTGYDAGPYLEWYATRANGMSEFRLDALFLVWVSDAARENGTALSVWCDDEGGIQSPDKLLLENFLDTWGRGTRRAYVAASDNDLKRVLQRAARGEFVELAPGIDHLLVLTQERAVLTTFTDDFESYKSDRWLPVAQMESNEDWGAYSPQTYAETSLYVEGAQARKIVFDGTTQYYDQWYFGGDVLDLSNDGRFTDDDFVCVAFHLSRDNIEDVSLEFVSGSAGFAHQWTTLDAGWNYVCAKRSAFSVIPANPTWDTITALLYRATLVGWYGEETLIADCWRIEKADPDNADVPNATGNVWDFQPEIGVWTIAEDVEAGNTVLACLSSESGVEKSALIHTPTPGDARLRARVLAKRDAGKVGLWARAAAATLTAGAEQGYAVVIDTSADTLLIRRYTGGTPTQLASAAFTAAENTWYVLGVIVKGAVLRVYAAAATALTDDADVFAAAYLRVTVNDSTYSSGYLGVLSIDTLGRFDNVALENIADKVIPADQITVSGQAVFRTIAPFA